MTRTVTACEKCGSANVELKGTNVRGAIKEKVYHCGDCDHRSPHVTRRSYQKNPPDKPPSGFARKVWEIGEQEASRSD